MGPVSMLGAGILLGHDHDPAANRRHASLAMILIE